MTTWARGALTAADTETTSPNPEDARVVEICLAIIQPGQPTDVRTAVVNPGVEVPDEAAAIHGYTTERVRAEGKPAPDVLDAFVEDLANSLRVGIPLVIMNAPYDLTLLDRELQRHGLPSLAEQAGREPYVIDPYVIDKALDKYRKGSRKLTDMATHYGVQLGEDAHDAGADALAAARIAFKLAIKFSALQRDLELLHLKQVTWAREQAISLQTYFRKTDPAAVVEGAWPLIPRPRAEEDR